MKAKILIFIALSILGLSIFAQSNGALEITAQYDKFGKSRVSRECDSAEVALPSMPANNTDDYYVIFEDHFNGTALDRSAWYPVIGIARDCEFKYQKAWHQEENITVSDGTLKITAERDTIENVISPFFPMHMR